MPTYSTVGITLLVHKYKGTQRLAVFYTADRGKLEAVVSGVGKPGSKLAPAVEPFTLSKLFLAEGRSFDRLTQCDVIESFYDIRKDMGRLGRASYVVELIAQTSEPGDPDPVLFDALRRTLAALTVSDDPELVMWAFVLRYLHARGIGPVLDRCLGCGCELRLECAYVATLGGCVCPECAATESGSPAVSPQARGAMRTLASLDLGRLDRLKLSPATRGQVRHLLRRHVRYHMGVSLKSEKFLDKMAPPASA